MDPLLFGMKGEVVAEVLGTIVVLSLIETSRATDAAWRLATALDTTFDGAPRKFCTMPRVRRDQAPDA
jgi:hypothetical protein